MQKRIRNTKKQDKVVFWMAIDNDNSQTTYYPESQEYVESIIESMLKKKNITTDTVFLGGEKEGIYRFLSALVENYHYREININDFTKIFEEDIDFE
jgi:hypothetical protein